MGGRMARGARRSPAEPAGSLRRRIGIAGEASRQSPMAALSHRACSGEGQATGRHGPPRAATGRRQRAPLRQSCGCVALPGTRRQGPRSALRVRKGQKGEGASPVSAHNCKDNTTGHRQSVCVCAPPRCSSLGPCAPPGCRVAPRSRIAATNFPTTSNAGALLRCKSRHAASSSRPSPLVHRRRPVCQCKQHYLAAGISR